jgi:adenylate kinase family enzyme
MPKELHVIIAGGGQHGKSTLAEFLQQRLAQVGITNVELIDESMPPAAALEWRMRQMHLTNTRIHIVTRHLWPHDECIEVAIDREENS